MRYQSPQRKCKMSLYDDANEGCFLPTREGVATGRSAERVLLETVGGSQGFRTKITDNADGSTTMLRTRNGMPEFTTVSPTKQMVGDSCEHWQLEEIVETRELDADTYSIFSCDGLLELLVRGVQVVHFDVGVGVLSQRDYSFATENRAASTTRTGTTPLYSEKNFEARVYHPESLEDSWLAPVGSPPGLEGVMFVHNRLKKIVFTARYPGKANKNITYELSASGDDAVAATGYGCSNKDLKERGLSTRLGDLSLSMLDPGKGEVVFSFEKALFSDLVSPETQGLWDQVAVIPELLSGPMTMSKVALFGPASHGLYRYSDNTLTLNNAEKTVITAPSHLSVIGPKGNCYAVRGKPLPPLVRNDVEAANDLAENREWLDYALHCGIDRKLNGVPFVNAFIYTDPSGARWVIRMQGTVDLAEIKVTAQRFGVIGGESGPVSTIVRMVAELPEYPANDGFDKKAMLICHKSTGDEAIVGYAVWFMNAPHFTKGYAFYKLSVSGLGDDTIDFAGHGLVFSYSKVRDCVQGKTRRIDRSSVVDTITHSNPRPIPSPDYYTGTDIRTAVIDRTEMTVIAKEASSTVGAAYDANEVLQFAALEFKYSSYSHNTSKHNHIQTIVMENGQYISITNEGDFDPERGPITHFTESYETEYSLSATFGNHKIYIPPFKQNSVYSDAYDEELGPSNGGQSGSVVISETTNFDSDFVVPLEEAAQEAKFGLYLPVNNWSGVLVGVQDSINNDVVFYPPMSVHGTTVSEVSEYYSVHPITGEIAASNTPVCWV